MISILIGMIVTSLCGFAVGFYFGHEINRGLHNRKVRKMGEATEAIILELDRKQKVRFDNLKQQCRRLASMAGFELPEDGETK